MDVGEALRTRITDHLLASIGKYFGRGGDADVVLARDGHGFRVDCTVTLASGQKLLTHGLGLDATGAFDQALGKAETRIRRYKRRLKSHDVAAEAKAAAHAASYVLRAPDDDVEDDDSLDDWANGAPPAAMIIAESRETVRTMTVSMAVMELDLTGEPAIVFTSAAHGGLSVVYRRADGNIGWVDPERTKSVNGGSKSAG
jgi:ribosomal subunit interface protein